jgi:hypothetical protein
MKVCIFLAYFKPHVHLVIQIPFLSYRLSSEVVTTVELVWAKIKFTRQPEMKARHSVLCNKGM